MSSIDIDINLVAKQALGSLKTIEDNVKKNRSAFSALGASVVVLNQGLQLAGKVWRSFSGSISDVINKAAIQQKSMNDLRFAFQSAGVASEQAADDFAQFAAELQKVTTFGDETTLSAAALFTQLTKVTGEGLKQATIAAQNLAATVGIDLESAMRLLAKTTEDGGSGLRRYGISVQRGATEAETLANAVNAVNRAMGGKAQAEMNSFVGLQKSLSNAWGDLKEQVGLAIIENETIIAVFRTLVVQIQAIPEYLKQIRNWFKENEDALKAAGSALLGVITAYGLYVLWTNKAIIATQALAVAKKVLAAVMAATPIGIVALAISGLVAGVFLLAKHFDLVSAHLKIFTGEMIQTFLPAIDIAMRAVSALVGVFNKEWAAAIEERRQGLLDFSESLMESGEEELEIIHEQNLLKEEEERRHQDEMNIIKTDAAIVDAKTFEDLNKRKELNNKSFTESFKSELTQRKKFEELTDKERVENFKSTANTIATLSQTNNKALKTIGKSAAITTATLDGIVAVQKALSAAPPPFNFALAALVGVATAANVAKIAGVPLAAGGVVMPRPGGTAATIAEAGKPEAVIPLDDERAREQMGALGGVTVIIQGNVIGEEQYIDELAKKLSDAVNYRNVELRATA